MFVHLTMFKLFADVMFNLKQSNKLFTVSTMYQPKVKVYKLKHCLSLSGSLHCWTNKCVSLMYTVGQTSVSH